MRNLKLILASIFVTLFILYGVAHTINNKNKFDFQTIELKSQASKIQELNIKYQKLNIKLQQTNNLNQEQINSLVKEKQKLEDEKKSLESQLQAKLDAKNKKEQEIALASSKIVNYITGTSVANASSNYSLLAQAGISESDYGYADYIIMHEGSYNPCVINGGAIDCNYAVNGGQKAYGACQSLPGSKMAAAGSDWATNVVTQIKWCNSYAIGRYGSWANAYSAWVTKGWW